MKLTIDPSVLFFQVYDTFSVEAVPFISDLPKWRQPEYLSVQVPLPPLAKNTSSLKTEVLKETNYYDPFTDMNTSRFKNRRALDLASIFFNYNIIPHSENDVFSKRLTLILMMVADMESGYHEFMYYKAFEVAIRAIIDSTPDVTMKDLSKLPYYNVIQHTPAVLDYNNMEEFFRFNNPIFVRSCDYMVTDTEGVDIVLSNCYNKNKNVDYYKKMIAFSLIAVRKAKHKGKLILNVGEHSNDLDRDIFYLLSHYFDRSDIFKPCSSSINIPEYYWIFVLEYKNLEKQNVVVDILTELFNQLLKNKIPNRLFTGDVNPHFTEWYEKKHDELNMIKDNYKNEGGQSYFDFHNVPTVWRIPSQ